MAAKQQTIVVSEEVVLGLIEVLTQASTNGQLTPKQRQTASVFADVLEGNVQASTHKAHVRLSIHVVANILRVVLMVIKPDPIVKAVIGMLGRLV